MIIDNRPSIAIIDRSLIDLIKNQPVSNNICSERCDKGIAGLINRKKKEELFILVRNKPLVTVYWLGGPSVSDVLQWDWIFVEARLMKQ
jgi:hypothetical protein